MIKTFIDSGVLMDAWKGTESNAVSAVSIMEDAGREFFTSQIVRLELLPKPKFHKRSDEVEFYESHFRRAKKEMKLSSPLADAAFVLAAKHNLAAADALNLAAALKMGVDEFVTSELSGKPMFFVPGIKVISSREL